MVHRFTCHFISKEEELKGLISCTVIEVEEDCNCYVIHFDINPWTRITMSFEKAFFDSLDHAFHSFQYIMRQSYVIKLGDKIS